MQDSFAPFRNALAMYSQTAGMPAQAAQTIAMDRRQQEQNAMANALQQMKIDEIRRKQQQSQGMDNALAQLFARPRHPGTGPMRGVQDYQPGQMQTPQPSYADIQSRLAPFGVEGLTIAEKFKPEQAEYQIIDGQYVPKQPGGQAQPVPGLKVDSFKDLSGDAKNLAVILGRTPTTEELKGYRKSGATNIDMSQTKGREQADKAFADEYVQYVASGGYADTMKQLGQLRGVLRDLESRDDLTGPIVGSIPDSVKKFTNPDAISTREAVEEVVQRNLRAVLGAQFTEKEGIRLISRAYNPNLSEKENAKRVGRLLSQIEKAANAKKSAADYFQRNGTLTGWKGKVPSINDFMDATAPKSAADYLQKFGGQ